jgi:transcription antitermination factor NusG
MNNLVQLDEPPLLWPEGGRIEDLPGRWWVAHVKPRQEKALAGDVPSIGGAYFLPMRRTVRRSRGRRWKALLPLFPGYVFLCGDELNRLAALKTNRIVRLIEVTDQSLLVRELAGIKRLLDAGLEVDAHPSLKKGAPCRIHCGPLEGLEGRVQRRKGRNQFVIDVSILGQGASVELDADMLQPID